MKLTVLLFACMMLLGNILMAQDPELPTDDSAAPHVECEPYLRVNYERNVQEMTIFYENCDIYDNLIYFGCGFGFCGNTITEGLNKESLNIAYQVSVTDFYGRVVYQGTSFEKPSRLVVSELNLEPGAYLLLMKKPGGEAITHKFGVK